MKVRNPKYNHIGTIDVEFEHPDLGWLPFTASPDDPEEHGRVIYQEALDGKFGPIEPYEE